MTIPNIPDLSKYRKKQEVDKTKNKSISIAYVGGFYEDRGLIELVETIKLFKNYELHIAGFGDYKIERFISDAANKTKNIYYYGRVSYNQALEIMQKADLLYAMYYKFNRNNIFAAPNKFYESIFLQKPIITTAGTLVAKKVLSHNSGYVIEEGNRALKDLLLSINKLDLISLKENLNKYKTKYTQTFNHCMIRYLRNIKDMYRRQ